METQPEKEERTELTHSQIVAPPRETILTDVEIQPEKEVSRRGIKILMVESLVGTLLGRSSWAESVSAGLKRTILYGTLSGGSARLIRQTFR